MFRCGLHLRLRMSVVMSITGRLKIIIPSVSCKLMFSNLRKPRCNSMERTGLSLALLINEELTSQVPCQVL